MSVSENRMLAVGGVASRLAAITGLGEPYHARQIRGLIRSKALTPSMYGGDGPTAAALFTEADLCVAMVLHTLASLNLDFALLARIARVAENLDDRFRKKNKVEPSRPMEFAIERVKSNELFYFHIGFSYLDGGKVAEVYGWLSGDPKAVDLQIASAKAFVTLPLHELLKPLLSEAN